MSTSAWAPLRPGDALGRWAMTAPEERLFPGRARPMADRVDYRFVNGWVDTGDLPCREALRAALTNRHVARPEGPFPDICLGDESGQIDFSRFCHRPTLVRHALQNRLRVEQGGRARFRIAACGGLYLWLGEKRIAAFEPFRRNLPQATEIDVDLHQGEASLTVLLEDLHERDTTCFFSLSYVDGPVAATALPVEIDTQCLGETADVLSSLRPDAVFLESGTVRLLADPVLSQPLALKVDGIAPFPRGGLSADPEMRRSVQIELTPKAPSAKLFNVEKAPAGCLSLDVTAFCGNARLVRRLGVTNLPKADRLPGDIDARKACAADLITDHAGFEPSVATLLAIRGEKPDRVDRILAAALTTIEERHDCSDFTILPLLRLWRDAGDNLKPALRQRLRAAILGYRYWLDEPGNDVMWFWSENHVLCFHSAQLIAGRLFPNEIFANSGKRGSTLHAEALARLHRWFDAAITHGLCEWNSAAYYPIDLLGLLSLFDMAPELRERSAALLDQIFIMIGLHSSGGVPAGSQGRCYEKELLAGPTTELGAVAAVAFGEPVRAGFDRASALFCLSDYVPPPDAQRFAGLTGSDQLEARYTQGLGHAGKLALWKSADGQLSTVVMPNPGGRGHQAHVLDVQMAAHPMARLWINHPGELRAWGERRPSLLAGSHVLPQVAQHGPTALMIYDLSKPWTDIGFTQLFAAPGAFDGLPRLDDWHVLSAGEGFVAVWCSRALEAVDGLYQGALRRAHGLRTAWIVTLSRPREDHEAFQARLRGSPPRFHEDRLSLSIHGLDGQALALEHDGAFRVDGTEQPFAPLDPRPHVGWNGRPLLPWRNADDRT